MRPITLVNFTLSLSIFATARPLPGLFDILLTRPLGGLLGGGSRGSSQTGSGHQRQVQRLDTVQKLQAVNPSPATTTSPSSQTSLISSSTPLAVHTTVTVQQSVIIVQSTLPLTAAEPTSIISSTAQASQSQLASAVQQQIQKPIVVAAQDPLTNTINNPPNDTTATVSESLSPSSTTTTTSTTEDWSMHTSSALPVSSTTVVALNSPSPYLVENTLSREMDGPFSPTSSSSFSPASGFPIICGVLIAVIGLFGVAIYCIRRKQTTNHHKKSLEVNTGQQMERDSKANLDNLKSPSDFYSVPSLAMMQQSQVLSNSHFPSVIVPPPCRVQPPGPSEELDSPFPPLDNQIMPPMSPFVFAEDHVASRASPPASVLITKQTYSNATRPLAAAHPLSRPYEGSDDESSEISLASTTRDSLSHLL